MAGRPRLRRSERTTKAAKLSATRLKAPKKKPTSPKAKKKCGPLSLDLMKKTKSLDELLGVKSIAFFDSEFEDAIEELPSATIKEITEMETMLPQIKVHNLIGDRDWCTANVLKFPVLHVEKEDLGEMGKCAKICDEDIVDKVKASRMGNLYLNMFQEWCFTSNLAYYPNDKKDESWVESSYSRWKGNIETLDGIALMELISAQEALQNYHGNEELLKKGKEARLRYNENHQNYLLFLSQKAKLAWIKNGDDNTKHFHASIWKRRVQNTIYSIKDTRGNWVEEQDKVIHAFLDFYQTLLGTRNASTTKVNKKIVREGVVISNFQAAKLIKDYTEVDVKHALFSIPDEKLLALMVIVVPSLKTLGI
uniref:Uncharacterized protein n=1 Tax=Cannabis sativa TaxID=3483 RepID=A0A803PZX6_CANSA